MPDTGQVQCNELKQEHKSRFDVFLAAWPTLREVSAVGVAVLVVVVFILALSYGFFFRSEGAATKYAECLDSIVATIIGYLFGYVPSRISATSAERRRDETIDAMRQSNEEREIYKEELSKAKALIEELKEELESGENCEGERDVGKDQLQTETSEQIN